MARLCCLAPFLLVFFALFLQTSESTLSKVISQSYRATGVFLLIEGETYTLNFTSASDACLSLNVTIASEIQMTKAVQDGLETCKYGWIAEQTAVIPRISSTKNCGAGKTGLVKWKAPANKLFGVFCFNASALTDLETTASPQSSTSSTPPTALTRTSTSSTPSVASTTKPMSSTKKPITTKPPQSTPSASASAVPIETSQSAGISSSPPPSLTTFSTPVPVSLPPLTTSSALTFIFTASTHAFNFPVSSESLLPQPESTAKPSLEGLDTALIILGIVLLLLTTASIMWYYKFYVFSCLYQGQQMDEMETEMWKCTDSEMGLHNQYGQEDDDEEEESYRKYSSDIMLCVKPDMKANSSE
ncbi:lymphatic vessel endothelial hyaluronic receptor 1b [Archocentrus centrarchus]|uniref:lymphatic vessel endothelial hyaluronic receptor 1b n=1 Tax=Archocentrus centrarchus TaxID=63155 RepID=UPI0011E9ED50|nr:lymphatic vessel endothelial hyaluronic acid receptor 1-like [Archocentrus centrarchus]